ncbi:MAG: cell surface protein SprA [Porphyromonas sp.]|nr:cell surface protein SprA [Porphyromonas sp.]
MQRAWAYTIATILSLACAHQVQAAPPSPTPDSVAYNPKLDSYLILQRDSLHRWTLHRVLSRHEYLELRRQRMGVQHFMERNRSAWEAGESVERRTPRLTFDIKGDINLGLSNHLEENDNPTLPVALRRRRYIDFVQRTNVHAQAKYGDHLGLDLTYNTETALTHQRQRLNLYYAGEEHDLIQRLEAGNVRFVSQNPLIHLGGEDLFGISGLFRLGPLSVQVLASQERSEERRISVRGSQRRQKRELHGSEYDFAQHYFLSEFFAQRYDAALSKLPIVQSDLMIEQVEVWVGTPKWREPSSDLESVRAYTSLALSTDTPPSNTTRDAGESGVALPSVKRLPESAYYYHPTLGFVSLKVPLAEGQTLMVAYRYRYNGVSYEVGSLSRGAGEELEAALLADQNHSPTSPLWHLMMKNGYSLPATPEEWTAESVVVQLLYRNHHTGIDQTAVEKGSQAGKSWLTLFGWDQMGASGVGGAPDGSFDLIEGVTFVRESATIFVPHRRPFDLVPKAANDGSDSPYKPYPQLYDLSRYEAGQLRELDRFVIRTEVEAGSAQTISLGTSQLPPGSVRVVSGSRELQEGTDYTINYATGQLSLASHTPEHIEIVLQEPRIGARRLQKTILGSEATLQLTPNLRVGGTALRYSEESYRKRIRWGEEAVQNTMWGIHLDYDSELPTWTEWLNDRLHLHLSKPVSLSMHSAYAHLSSSYASKGGEVVLEDFEQGQQYIDLGFPQAWKIASTPFESSGDYRAQMAWYQVDPLLVREGAEHQPEHLRKNSRERSDPFVREIKVDELFPRHDYNPLRNNMLPTLNLSFYPKERGPYNLNTTDLLPNGELAQPQQMWGAMMRPLETRNLEEGRFAYIEGWLLDPFYQDQSASEGRLVIDLGQFSDEILPHGSMAFESALPTVETDWGRVPMQMPQTYGFDRLGALAMEQQDVGLNGLSSEEEAEHNKYAAYLREVERITGFQPWESSEGMQAGDPRRDPSGDDYHFFLGAEWDRIEAPIRLRYKYINGVEGNALDRLVQGVQSAQTWEPDAEDLDRDMIFSAEEHYFRYEVPISREALSLQSKFVIAERLISPRGATETAAQEERWVKVRIPIREPQSVHGRNVSLQDIRSIRLALTEFQDEIHLRWARLRLVASPWSPYDKKIEPSDQQQLENLSISALSLEEDEGRTPIPYVSPPGVEREQTYNHLAAQREDEKALSVSLKGLQPNQPAAAYQVMSLDLRHFEELGLYVHLESPQILKEGDLELFVRMGYDFTDNFYEVRMPLSPTPLKDYSHLDRQQLQKIVWPEENHLRLRLDRLTELKSSRMSDPKAEANAPYLKSNPDDARHTLVVQGFPTLGDITSVMIGVRSRASYPVEAEVWINELTAKGDRDTGGHALQADGKLTLAELAEFSLSYYSHSAGFGSLKSNPRRSPMEDREMWELGASLDLGQLLPQRWQASAPITYLYQRERSTPFYAPGASDLKYTEWERLGNDRSGKTLNKLQYLTLRDWHLAANPNAGAKLFSPSNLRFSYQVRHQSGYSPELAGQEQRHSTTALTYSYEPTRGNYLRLSSYWDRYYQRNQHTEGATLLQSRWNWERGLHLRWQLLSGLFLGLQSKTTALIWEPFETQLRGGGSADFQLFTKEIMESIGQLGETMHYFGNSEISYRLPSFEQAGLKGLTGSLRWRSQYNWNRGLQQGELHSGNPIQNKGELMAEWQYSLLPLFSSRGKPPFASHLTFRYSHQVGSSVPGFIPTAGKALGITIPDRHIAPSVGYILAVTPMERELHKMAEQGWVLQDSKLARQMSHHQRDDLSSQLSLTPLKGLKIDLNIRYNRLSHTEWDPSNLQRPTQESGTIRLSTIGLKGFLKKEAASHFAVLPDDPEGTFLQRHTLLSHSKEGLPTLTSLLPNWLLVYDLPNIGGNKGLISAIRVRHHYYGELEIPKYLLNPNSVGERYQPQSIRQTDEMNPLLGIEVELRSGLTLEERLIRRRIATLMVPSDRVMQQVDNELYSQIKYKVSLKPLFKGTSPWLRSMQNQLSLHLSHSYTMSEMYLYQLLNDTSYMSRGLQTHKLQCSAEYTLTEIITLRAFYEESRRTPLVSNYSFPVLHRSYGMILNLRLQI